MSPQSPWRIRARDVRQKVTGEGINFGKRTGLPPRAEILLVRRKRVIHLFNLDRHYYGALATLVILNGASYCVFSFLVERVFYY